MTFTEAKKDFIRCSSSYNDYWEMQISWESYKDGLCRDGVITQTQFNNWGNPTTPEKFKSWKKKNNL